MTVWAILKTWSQQNIYCIPWSHGKHSSDTSLHFCLFLRRSLLIHVDAALYNAISISLGITQYWGVDINTKQRHKLKFQGAMSRSQSLCDAGDRASSASNTYCFFPSPKRRSTLLHCPGSRGKEAVTFTQGTALHLHLQMVHLTSNWSV